MDFKRFLSEHENVKSENKLLKFVIDLNPTIGS